MNRKFFPAEWHAQSFVQLTWPHKDSDWDYIYDEAIACFRQIANEISKRQKLLIVCQDPDLVKKELGTPFLNNIIFHKTSTNDVWARDHGGITIINEGVPEVLNFKFNGWGLKYPAHFDNQISDSMHQAGIFTCGFSSQLDFVLEGGSIESDGYGTILTTEKCLLSKNRNEQFSKAQVEHILKERLGVDHILWLAHGHLAGDDTDSHIDTLARFVGPSHIVYVQCTDKNDEHYLELQAMERELKSLRQKNGKAYQLTALPMVPAVYFDEERLPATYANFLIMNSAVLLPIYEMGTDRVAIKIMEQIFPDKEIVPIDCSPLIKEHGSLHCVTMQYPELVLSQNS